MSCEGCVSCTIFVRMHTLLIFVGWLQTSLLPGARGTVSRGAAAGLRCCRRYAVQGCGCWICVPATGACAAAGAAHACITCGCAGFWVGFGVLEAVDLWAMDVPSPDLLLGR